MEGESTCLETFCCKNSGAKGGLGKERFTTPYRTLIAAQPELGCLSSGRQDSQDGFRMYIHASSVYRRYAVKSSSTVLRSP